LLEAIEPGKEERDRLLVHPWNNRLVKPSASSSSVPSAAPWPWCGPPRSRSLIAHPQAIGQFVNQPQSAELGSQSAAAKWHLVDCPKSGKKLYPQGTPVEVVEVSSVRPA
jgi:hypothetical protein